MFIDIWTIINPIIRTFVYITALYSIGSILFKFHFQKYFNDLVVNNGEEFTLDLKISGFENPIPWAKNFKGLSATFDESNCLILPAAAFLGFANSF